MASRRRTEPDYPEPVRRGIVYADAVAAGRVATGKWTRLAAQRFQRDRVAAAGESRWRFDPEFALGPITLAGKLPNIKGPEAGQPLRLEDFQCWLISNLYGFIERGTPLRRFRQASLWLGKGNAKSTLSAALALYSTFIEGEGGAEGYTAAVSRDQARIVFDIAQAMARRSRQFRATFGVEVREHSVHQPATMSRLTPVSSDAKSLDGLNVHFAVLDEIASHRSKAVYDVILTAMGKRLQPLLISISTATDNVTGIGKQVWDYSCKVLEGLADERFFALIYAADETDDPWDERTWIKANPGWGRLVQPEALRSAAIQAKASPALQAAFMTRHLNLWVGTDSALFDLAHWDRCANPQLQLKEFEAQPCFVAIDMATRVDLPAASLLFPYCNEGEEVVRYAVFHKAWLPEAAVDPNTNPLYLDWVERRFLEVTEGETTDYAVIEEWLRGVARRFDLRACGYDPYALMQFAQRAMNDGLPMIEYRATVLNFSEPTKILDALMREGRLEHDASPVARWCVGNVVGHYDRRNNVYPNKPRLEAKIDCAITTIMALGVSIAAEQEQRYIYQGDRELLVF